MPNYEKAQILAQKVLEDNAQFFSAQPELKPLAMEYAEWAVTWSYPMLFIDWFTNWVRHNNLAKYYVKEF